ncbi:MAG: uridine kinase [Oscillospiraceae bacterium]|nr:uridine kinase [Oscillospiraceae bacterium]
MKPLVLGIAGGTNSGKTTLTQRLARCFGRQVTVLSHDSYYKRHDHLTYEERTQLNYDAPESFENQLMIDHLDSLIRGESVECPVYDYTVHNRSEQVEHLDSAPVILVEGILIFAEPALRDRMDVKVFVDAPADVRILRRIARDVRDRGRTVESVMSQYLNTVRPMHELHVEPSKQYADMIVLHGGMNEAAYKMLEGMILQHLHSWQEGERD